MKQNILKLIFVILYTFLISSVCFAATGAATTYEVKMAKVEVYNKNTSTWVTAYDDATGTLALNIASVSAGTAAGVFAAGLDIPDGVYTKSKVTPARTFRIAGSFSGYHTTAATEEADGRTVSTAAAGTGAGTLCDVTILQSDVDSVGVVEQDFTSTPITIKNGNADHKIRVIFDISATLTLTQTGPTTYIIYPNPPTVTVSIVD